VREPLLAGNVATIPADVNAAGLVVGSATVDADPFGATDGAVWDNGAFTRLARLNPDATYQATAVNGARQIVGIGFVEGSPHGVVWSDPTDPAPAALPGFACQPADINDLGTVVGVAHLVPGGAGPNHPVVWPSASAAPQVLKGFAGTAECGGFATAINQLGEIVGACRAASGVLHAAYWPDKDAVPIELVGSEESVALGVNELGQIVGGAGSFAGGLPVMWSREGAIFRRFHIGVPGDVLGPVVKINNTGQAISGNGGYLWSVFVRAAMDLLPGRSANVIKLDGRGTVDAVLLGSRWFNAADVDRASLTLGNDDGIETGIVRRKTGPVAKLSDVNRDGFPDLTATFDQRQLMSNGDLAAGTTLLVLLGRFNNGRHLRGTDVVQVQ
jgi:uncharacterized membrane protein